MEEQGTDHYDSDDLSDVLIGPATEGDFVRLQIDFYQKYGEHKELLQYFWEAMHTAFPIASTSAIVRQLSIGEYGEVLEPSIIQ